MEVSHEKGTCSPKSSNHQRQLCHDRTQVSPAWIEVQNGYQEEIFDISNNLNILIQIINELPKKVPANGSPRWEIPKEITSFQRLSQKSVIGRSEDLTNLRAALLTHHEIVLVNGMGGIGKTTLAAFYIDTYYDDYDHIVWLTLTSNLDAAIAENPPLLENLQLKNVPPEELSETCLNRLRTLHSGKPLLLILDNASEGLSSYHDRLPKPPNAHVLITSRELIEPFHPIELDFLIEPDAVKLFQLHNDNFEIDEIKMIVRKIEYHTLTIEMLAKSAKTNRWGLEKTMLALSRNGKANIQIPHSGFKKIDRIKTYLSSIFLLSIQDDHEKYILKQFLFLPYEWLSYSFLGGLFQVEQLDWTEDFASLLDGLSKGKGTPLTY